MKKVLILLFFAVFGLFLRAQESTSAFGILKLPTSAHAAALGGENTSTLDDDPALAQHNPALLASVLHRTAGVSFMSYADGAQWMGAQYVHAFGQRHTLGVFAQYMNYGKMTETDATGMELGTFSAKDIIVGGGYSYLLNRNWAGGANLKLVSSAIANYSSSAVVVDLGLNYFDEDRNTSLSFVLRNAGAQLRRFDGLTENIPYSLQIGFSRRLEHLPLRWTASLVDMTRWNRQYYYSESGGNIGTSRLVLNHLVLGADLYLSSKISLAVGYNFRRAYELKALGGTSMAGLSAGLGIDLYKLKINLSWARYHKATASLMGTIAYTFRQ